MITGMRRGPDGYALERNTRYADHWGGNKATAALSLEMWEEIQGDTGRHREMRPPCLSRCVGRCGEIQGDTAARREGDATPVLAVSAPAAATLAAAALAASLREGWRRSTGPSRTQAGRRERRGIAPVPLATHSQTHGWTGALLPQEMLAHLLSGRLLNGWVLRQTLEACATYACAVGRLTSSPYASTEYAVISGVRKGTILARGARCDGGPVPSPPESERTEGESGREPRERAERESLE